MASPSHRVSGYENRLGANINSLVFLNTSKPTEGWFIVISIVNTLSSGYRSKSICSYCAK